MQVWAYDAGLSSLGVAVTLSAASGFGHRAVRNEASGVLDEHATVTHAEMLEHSFYQALNLVQVSFLRAPALEPLREHETAHHSAIVHCMQVSFLHAAALGPLREHAPARVAMALLATMPWRLRARFPVNSFSKNYSQPGRGGKTPLIRALYRLKKYQYLLYKHALLHGLNASVAVTGWAAPRAPAGLANAAHFRLYWLCLNTAYVMEFFMQTLVKRGYLEQTCMLLLQQLLMLVSTSAAVQVLEAVRLVPALLSLGLNFARRGHEVSNMGAVVLAAWLLPSHSLDLAGMRLSL